MKLFFLVTVLSALMSGAAFSDPDLRTSPTGETPRELVRLREEFDRRRADALRPSASWYRAQLEALLRSCAGEAPARKEIAKALADAREGFWEDDQPELRQALLATPWLWRSEDDAEGVATQFSANGSVGHIGMRGRWRITGPCEVTIQGDGGETFVLHFNASLSAYEADRRAVSGHRLASVP